MTLYRVVILLIHLEYVYFFETFINDCSLLVEVFVIKLLSQVKKATAAVKIYLID